jgi:hypothetical protein
MVVRKVLTFCCARGSADAGRGAAEFSAQTLDLARRAQQTVSLERAIGEGNSVLAEIVPDLDAPAPFDVVPGWVARASAEGRPDSGGG